MKAFHNFAGLFSFLMAVFASTAFSQSVVQLPVNLADPGTQVVGVLNQDPRAGQNNRTLGFSEGPAVDSAGNLYFSENAISELNPLPRIWKVPPQGTASIFFESSLSPNGLEFDPQGRLVADLSNMVLRFNQNGSRDTLIRSGNGLNLGSLNDLTINSAGYMILTNYTGNKLFLLEPNGALADSVSISGNPNGVEWVEETNTIYLNLTASGKVTRYNWALAMNSRSFRQFPTLQTDFIPRVATPDGITLDSLGNFYVVSNSIGTVVVYSPAGDSIGRITVTARAALNATNCAFGGSGNKTLYITGNGGAYKVQLKVAGRRRPASTTAIRSAWRIQPLRQPEPNAEIYDLLGRDFFHDPEVWGFGNGKKPFMEALPHRDR